ncbi:hypothetical protein NL312_30270, partial [Klebsiella pneumoniae]|nr:hypothetical protein [Klebsiella pneumoniae]
MTIAEPVRLNGNMSGVVGADVLIDQLIADVISMDAGKNAQTMLIDGQNGSFLAHPDKSLLLKPVTTLSSALDMRT